MSKLSFSGHESFNCKMHWLKKGYDFVYEKNSFTDLSSVVKLGVGKNMVSAINYWMHSFDLLDENSKELTKFAQYIFADNGKDPYLEDPGTLWLLHYLLIKKNKASIYSLFFNEFRKERIEFTKESLMRFIEIKSNEFEIKFNETTVERDINVFLKNYLKPRHIKSNLEDNFNSLFVDLNLIIDLNRFDDKSRVYKVENKLRQDIPFHIILFVILDKFENGQSISFDKALHDINGLGNVFAINASGFINKINDITKNYKGITLKDDAGIRELQIKCNISKYSVLNDYYEK